MGAAARRAGALAVLASAVLACERAAPPADAQRATDRPDVVLVSIDSLRHDHLGCYGYPRDTSPTIDRLAAEGVRFDNAVSTTSWTLPAHAALFTGLYDTTHGLDSDGLRLSDDHRTLAEALREAGWTTAGFFGGPYLHPSFGLGQGFDTYQSCMTQIPDDVPEVELRYQAFWSADAAHQDVTGPRLLAELERWMEGAGRGPWFLFLHLWDVHYDYLAPREYVERFDPGYTGPLTGRGFLRDPAIAPDMPARDYQHLMALYDAEIRFTDDTLAGALALLERRGRLQDALVVVTADHGEEFFEHGNKGHRRTLYDEVLRIPLVVRWPGRIDAGRVVEQQVRLIDVMPTILGLLGVEPPTPIQGRDLTPLLRGAPLAPAPALAELRGKKGRRIRALRTERAKLIDGGRRTLLFDLVEDPRERDPRSAPPAVRRQLAALVEAAERLHQDLGGEGAVPTAVAPDIRERLEALGYLEEGSESGAGPGGR